jgi:four helix bundle protein
MRFTTLDLALEAQQAVAPLIKRVQRHDRKLAQQLRDATNSFLLNLGEGAHSDPGTRRSRYQNAAGSTSEVLVGLRGSVGWGYLSAEELSPAAAKLDRLLGALWKLTH